MRSERSRAMFERLKDYADRINDQLGTHKASARSGSVERHRALAPCAPGNPGHLQVRRAMGGGASSGAARLGTVSYCDQGTLLSRAALRRAPAAPGRPPPVAAAWWSAGREGRIRAPIRIEFNNAVRIKTNTEDESDAELICGRLKFHAAPDNLIIAALPAAIVLRLGPGEPFHRMRMLVQAIDEELEAGRPGATAVAEDLASALFVMMLRGHFDQAACSNNLMKLLVSPPSARAVTAMLRAPALDWTLDELAAESHVSRATLVRIFRKAAGIAPHTFLAELRLGLAHQRLASTSVSLAQVAAAVGYESESAFARAFQRRFGISPGKLRGLHRKPAV